MTPGRAAHSPQGPARRSAGRAPGARPCPAHPGRWRRPARRTPGPLRGHPDRGSGCPRCEAVGAPASGGPLAVGHPAPGRVGVRPRRHRRTPPRHPSLAAAPLTGITGWYRGLFANAVCAVFAAALVARLGLWRRSGLSRCGAPRAAPLVPPFVAEALLWPLAPGGPVERAPGYGLRALTLLPVGADEEPASRVVIPRTPTGPFSSAWAAVLTTVPFGPRHLPRFAVTDRPAEEAPWSLLLAGGGGAGPRRLPDALLLAGTARPVPCRARPHPAPGRAGRSGLPVRGAPRPPAPGRAARGRFRSRGCANRWGCAPAAARRPGGRLPGRGTGAEMAPPAGVSGLPPTSPAGGGRGPGGRRPP